MASYREGARMAVLGSHSEFSRWWKARQRTGLSDREIADEAFDSLSDISYSRKGKSPMEDEKDEIKPGDRIKITEITVSASAAAQASVNEYFNERLYGAPDMTEEGRDNVRRVYDEMILGKPRWTDKDRENARRGCPTCGTPACNHPDRIRGEDALPIPPEALIAGRTMVQNFLPQYEWRTCEAIAEGIFREMLEKCSK